MGLKVLRFLTIISSVFGLVVGYFLAGFLGLFIGLVSGSPPTVQTVGSKLKSAKAD